MSTSEHFKVAVDFMMLGNNSMKPIIRGDRKRNPLEEKITDHS
jgi:hypothetical protein